MAQYIFVSASSFGNAHSDSPTYSFSVGTGTIYLSGSGGYVNSPTGISQATLDDPGVYLELSDESLTYVTCSVDSGFTCAGTVKYVSWTPAPSPTPTSTPTVSNVSIYLEAIAQESATWPEYTVVVAINGFKSTTRTLQQTNSNGVTDNFALSLTGTPDGTGTITFSRTSPDSTVADSTTLTVSQLNGHTTSPASDTYTNGQAITNVSFSVSGFDLGETLEIDIREG